MLPPGIGEGDHIEIGNIGAYGRVMAGHFNGYGYYSEAILKDEPMLSMYADAEDENRVFPPSTNLHPSVTPESAPRLSGGFRILSAKIVHDPG